MEAVQLSCVLTSIALTIAALYVLVVKRDPLTRLFYLLAIILSCFIAAAGLSVAPAAVTVTTYTTNTTVGSAAQNITVTVSQVAYRENPFAALLYVPAAIAAIACLFVGGDLLVTWLKRASRV